MVEAPKMTLNEALAELVNDPLGYVYFAFPWGEVGTILEFESGPDEWQTDVLEKIAEGLPLQEAIRIAVRSGHGIGKTALIAMIIKWFMDTHPHPQVVVTANTKIQLSSKTWREVSKWHNISKTKDLFTVTGSQFYRNDAPETWNANAIPWVKEKSEAFAGTHEKHVLYLFDEASAIDDGIWEVSDGAMTGTSEQGEAITKIWIAFGNPTRNTGRFSECFSKYRHRWDTMEIDSRTTKKADKKEIEQWLEDWGEDSDFFRVRVRGMEPRAGDMQFIGSDLVLPYLGAYTKPDTYIHAPKVMGIDVARGDGDMSVICKRQGTVTFELIKMRGLDTGAVAARVAQEINDWSPDATFIDVGFNPGVYDTLKDWKFKVTEIFFGGSPLNKDHYRNKRAEMWALMKKYLQTNPVLPDDKDLRDDLLAPQYGGGTNDGGKLLLESKQDMKKRGIASPDCGDALALTFAYPVLREKKAPINYKKKDKQKWNVRRGKR